MCGKIVMLGFIDCYVYVLVLNVNFGVNVM